MDEFQKEIQKQNKELDELEQKYDDWEKNLDDAELALFQYQDMIELLHTDDKNIDKFIQSLEDNYKKLEEQVIDLEKKYPKSDNKYSIDKANEVLNLLQKLNSDIDRYKESPFIKAINPNFGNSPINPK